tara:strand:+ start:427 stop:696 length:270 start_codon:yes stop_codon:yes gene_type:complete
MTVDLSHIHVDSDEERLQWIDLLYSGVNYHKAMAIEVEMANEIKSLETTHNPDVMYHTAMANAIRDCITMIEMLKIEGEEDEGSTDSVD